MEITFINLTKRDIEALNRLHISFVLRSEMEFSIGGSIENALLFISQTEKGEIKELTT